MLLGSGAAALLTTGATAIIFEERLKEGAWAYFVLVPTLFFAFAWFRQNLGPPSRVEDRLGRVIAASYLPPNTGRSLYTGVAFRNVLVPLDGSPSAEAALTVAQTIARAYGARIRLLSVVEGGDGSTEASSRAYLDDVTEQLVSGGQAVEPQVEQGDPAEIIGLAARRDGCDLVVMTTHGRRRWQRWFVASVTSDVIYQTTPPLVVLRPTENWHSARTRFSRLLVCLDGSEIAEQVLPYVHELAARFNSHVILLSVQEGSDSETYPDTLHRYLERLAADLRAKGTEVQVVVESSAPAQAILHTARTEAMDTIMMVSHGRGGVARQDFVKLGSVVDLVLQSAECPVFLVSALPAADHPMPRDSTTRSRTA
jgi:nucleotide-binding universal stress UspA family protein